MKIYKNISLKDYNYLHIDYKASLLIEIHNIQDIYNVSYICNYFNVDYVILGNGSKILFKDYLIKKVIIYINKNFKYKKIINNSIIVSSGENLKDIILYLANNNFGGFHKLYPIPATIGGLIATNAGIKEYEIKDFVNYVITINKDLKIKKYYLKDCKFNYRDSIFKKNDEFIILVCLKIYKIDKNIILKDIKQEIINRIKTQGYNKYSCGSLFKNFKDKKAYEIINDFNLNTLNINGICFSKKHSNILVNNGNGTNIDILNFIKIIKEKVKKESNIDLDLELIIK